MHFDGVARRGTDRTIGNITCVVETRQIVEVSGDVSDCATCHSADLVHTRCPSAYTFLNGSLKEWFPERKCLDTYSTSRINTKISRIIG